MAELRKSPPLSLAFMTQKEQLLRFLSLVPYLSPSGKRPKRNQRRTKERPKNSQSIEVRFVKINKHIYPPLLTLKQALYVWNFETFQLKICTSANFVVSLHRKLVCRHNKKRLLALVLAVRKLETFSPIQSKKAVNARWDMYIPPAERPLWTALFGGSSYSAWALLAYSYRKGFPVPLTEE